MTTQLKLNNNYPNVYIVNGCADLTAPEHAWHKRAGDVATIGCQHQNRTWNLKCVGTSWDGVVGLCKSSGKSECSHITVIAYGRDLSNITHCVVLNDKQ